MESRKFAELIEELSRNDELKDSIDVLSPLKDKFVSNKKVLEQLSTIGTLLLQYTQKSKEANDGAHNLRIGQINAIIKKNLSPDISQEEIPNRLKRVSQMIHRYSGVFSDVPQEESKEVSKKVSTVVRIGVPAGTTIIGAGIGAVIGFCVGLALAIPTGFISVIAGPIFGAIIGGLAGLWIGCKAVEPKHQTQHEQSEDEPEQKEPPNPLGPGATRSFAHQIGGVVARRQVGANRAVRPLEEKVRQQNKISYSTIVSAQIKQIKQR